MPSYNSKEDFRSIDWSKLKMTISATEEGRVGPKGEILKYQPSWKQRSELKFGRLVFQTPNGVSKTWTWDAGDKTLLYAIVSHLHGKLHIQKMRIPIGDASGGTMVVPFTMEMQTQLVGEAWKEFLHKEPNVALDKAV